METRFDDPVRQEIWTVLRALNDTWTRGDASRLTDFFHADMLAITPVDRHRRTGRAQCVAGWKGFCDAARIFHWREIDPVIHVYGDSAVVAYDYDMRFEMNGQVLSSRGRDMFFFARIDGKWWAVADQFSPYPG